MSYAYQFGGMDVFIDTTYRINYSSATRFAF